MVVQTTRVPVTKLKLANDVDHLHRGHSRVGSGVAHLRPGPFHGLFERLTCQDAEDRRDAGFVVNLPDPSNHLLKDRVVVTGLAPNHSTQAQNSRVLATGRQLLGRDRDLTGTGDPNDRYLFIGRTVTLEAIDRSTDQFGGNELIEPTNDDGILALAGGNLTFDFLDHNPDSPRKRPNLVDRTHKTDGATLLLYGHIIGP